MNLHACLGVGPGHRLLLGAATPTHAYRVPMMDRTEYAPYDYDSRPRAKALRPRFPRAGGVRTSSPDNEARDQRILAAARAAATTGDTHQMIADREGVCREHVVRVVAKARGSRIYRTRDQVTALADRVRALMTEHGWTQERAATECGISSSYASQLLVRKPPRCPRQPKVRAW